MSTCSDTVVVTPPGTTVCGCGYLPNRIEYASFAGRVICRPSRYSLPVSGLKAFMRSAIVRKPCMSACRVSVFLARSHSDGVVRSTTTCE